MARFYKTRTIQQIAISIRDFAIATAPKDTGRLRKYIKEANTPVVDKMIKQYGDFTTELILDYAGGNAPYGEYWNSPYGKGNGRTAKIKKRYPQHFDYADKALNNAESVRLFQDYLNELGEFIISDIEKELDTL